MLPGIVGEDADDTGGHDGGGHAKYTDKGCYPIDFADDLRLNLLFMGDGFIEEELVFLVEIGRAHV